MRNNYSVYSWKGRLLKLQNIDDATDVIEFTKHSSLCKHDIILECEVLDSDMKVTGKKFVCQECGFAADNLSEVYSRVVGYLRPTSQWNAGKISEFHDRKTYKGLGNA